MRHSPHITAPYSEGWHEEEFCTIPEGHATALSVPATADTSPVAGMGPSDEEETFPPGETP